MTARLNEQEDSTKQGTARGRKALFFEMKSVRCSKSVENWEGSKVAVEIRNHRFNLHGPEDTVMEKAMEDDYSLDAPLMCGWSFEIDYDIVMCCKRIEGGYKSCVEHGNDGALFTNKQEDVLKHLHGIAICENNTYAVEFVINEEALLAKDYSSKMEQVLTSLEWRQHGENSEKLLSYGAMIDYLHIINLERDGVLYLSDILQNYIFDPGGKLLQLT